MGGFPGGEEDTRFNHPWFEKIGGEWHCHLCGVVATEGHITSERHVRRQQYPESYGYTSQKKPEGDPSLTRVDEGSSTSRGTQWVTNIDYDKPWFERRDGDYYCLLCWAYATEGHVMSNRHVQRESFPSYYGFQSGKQDTQFDHPWYEKVSGEWFCHLCDARATEEHLNSERHVRRQLCPERYGYSSERRRHERRQKHGMASGGTRRHRCDPTVSRAVKCCKRTKCCTPGCVHPPSCT